MTALVLALLAQIPGAGLEPVRGEAKDWRLLETAHFNIYYPADALLPRARQFAGWFEDARARLVRKTGVEPRRVHVFLYRSFHDLLASSFLARREPLSTRLKRTQFDDSRASPADAHRFCRPNVNSRALALAEPLRDRIFIHVQASDRWNAWFVRHELAHHVQYAHLFPWTLPGYLVALKYPLTGSWWWEGGADYLANIYDSAKDQYVRDLARERLYDMKELFFPFDTVNPYDFQAHYNEGSYFWRFLDEKYGDGCAMRVFNDQDSGIPIPSQRGIQRATGQKRKVVEAAFAEHLAAQWAPMMAGRSAPTDRLTDTREYYRRRSWGGRWSPDGKRLAWTGDRHTWPDVYVDGEGQLGWRRGLDTAFVQSRPSWSPDSKKLVVVEWTVRRDVLLIIDLDNGLETIALDFDELYDPAWSPDGKRIAFSALKDGTSDLWILHLDGRRLERVTDDADADSEPAWSRDGTLAWIKETDGRTILHVAGQGAVTKSWAQLQDPDWAPDGKSILVSADVGGIYDAFAVDPATGQAKRLTRFAGGVSHPQMHPTDGTLLFTYYEGRGQDLYRARCEPQDEPAFDQEDRRSWYEQFVKPPPAGTPAEKSRVWGVDWFMAPVGSTSWLAPGLEFQFADRDAENTFYLVGAFDTAGWLAGATLSNTRWRPTFGISSFASFDDDFYEWRATPFVEYQLVPTLGVEAGWTYRWRRDRIDHEEDPEFTDSGPVAGLLFSNLAGYRLRDSAWGLAFGGSVAWFDDGLGGDRDLREYTAFFETAKDLFSQDWTVWLRLQYDKLDADRDELLDGELPELEDVLRGAEDLEGAERGVASLEFRFPIWRDLLWKPLELIGIGEWLIIKDLRGFVFAQAGYAGDEFSDFRESERRAFSAGVGLRIDFSVMIWPIVNARVPVRLEVWGAVVRQDDPDPDGDDTRFEAGIGVRLGV